MDVFLTHLVYIIGTFAGGVVVGWMSFPLYERVIRPALSLLRKEK